MQNIQTLSRLSSIVLAAIALLASLDAIENIAIPSALALVIGFVLSPLSDFWERRRFDLLPKKMDRWNWENSRNVPGRQSEEEIQVQRTADRVHPEAG